MKSKKKGKFKIKIKPLIIILAILIVAQAMAFYFIFDIKSENDAWGLKCSNFEIVEKSSDFESCSNPSCEDLGNGIQRCVCSDNNENIFLRRCTEVIKVIPVVYVDNI